MSRVGYRAFISYSHRDSAIARWLHTRLETYRFPTRLVGKQTAAGTVPRRLAPIFRDREEFSAAGSLTEEVEQALAASDALIIVCSPNSAASPWVAREIEIFRALHPARPILLALVRDTPENAFPPLLLADGVEPLAADLRAEGDGRRLGLLKLLAGLAGLPLGELVQRDAQRRLRRVTAVTVAAVAAMLVLGALTIVALQARDQAERRRVAAEGLIEFMLTDLREKLKGVGRVSVLSSANRRALDYYATQDLDALPPDALARRSRALLAMGEDEMEREDFAAAKADFAEARRTTDALIRKSPDDPEVIFAHAQSEFWVGSMAWQDKDLETAGVAFERYATLAERLAAVAPRDPRSLKEVGYATGNLCSLRYEQDRKQGLVDLCLRALHAMQAASALQPDDTATTRDVANRYAWVADAYRKVGNLGAALSARRAEAAIIARLLARDPDNVRVRRMRVWSERALAVLEHDSGDTSAARTRFERAIRDLSEIVAADPENRDLARELEKMKAQLLSW